MLPKSYAVLWTMLGSLVFRFEGQGWSDPKKGFLSYIIHSKFSCVFKWGSEYWFLNGQKLSDHGMPYEYWTKFSPVKNHQLNTRPVLK